jgi:hypothetical protein
MAGKRQPRTPIVADGCRLHASSKLPRSVLGLWGRANGSLESQMALASSAWSKLPGNVLGLWGWANEGHGRDKAGSTPPVVPGAAPALAKAGVGGLDYDYWRSTPPINKQWFINPGLTLYIYNPYISLCFPIKTTRAWPFSRPLHRGPWALPSHPCTARRRGRGSGHPEQYSICIWMIEEYWNNR